ncbi:hypothetical protein M9Y10_014050 [Tritrichomonas musculus]|uniref:F5/8 type C domain-containing protein n=1 Tax=Tritrichomonas musculus TaxID=1915356 RepID=A0ABR2KYG8_9EUKA
MIRQLRKEMKERDEMINQHFQKVLKIQKEPIKSDTNFDLIEIENTCGNIHDNRTILVTTNSIYSDIYHPKNLLNSKAENKQMQIEISDYSVRAADSTKTLGFMKNWFLEVSDDGVNWRTISEHTNSEVLKGPNMASFFKVSEKKFSRFCRIRHTGEFWLYRPFS